jgi:hypothetical protein
VVLRAVPLTDWNLQKNWSKKIARSSQATARISRCQRKSRLPSEKMG